MGNNGSRDQPVACSNGLEGTNRVCWSQSFPRELARHRSQPAAARKVLPEPPNQRLRATDNGSIIHNGGTISGRRAPTFASARDLSKRYEPPFRERTGSVSNLIEPRSRRLDRHCCRYRSDPSREANLKKFGSEPDLRCTPDLCCSPGSINREESRTPSSSNRYAREPKERFESRYKAKKKYKAPAPPPALGSGELAEESTAGGESRCSRDPDSHPRPHSHNSNARLEQHQVQPPPRRSRLFKTRAESRKTQISWQLSSSSSGFDRERSTIEPPNRWNGAIRSRAGQHSDNEASVDDRVRRSDVDEHLRRSRLSSDEGKNTLQRSMSSPEFQAELIQVARKVRDKLNSSGRTIVGEESTGERKDRLYETEDRRDFKERGRTTSFHGHLDVSGNREVDGSTDRDAKLRQQSYEGPKNRSKDASVARNCNSPVSNDKHREKKNSESGRLDDHRINATTRNLKVDRKWTENAIAEKPETRNSVADDRDAREQDQFAAGTQVAPKTFYFGMNECPEDTREDQNTLKEFETKPKFQEEIRPSIDANDDTDDNEKSVVENISLKLRPTLPKKQLEIPRFSPSAAWRLLSALEAPGPSMSTASEEMPVMFEERIERLSRPPPPFPLSLGPRSWHDKSGDSGISGDAGAPNEDSLDVSTINRMKTTTTRPTWTPQQDLGEESSSDAGVDSPPPLPTPLKYHSPRAHVFSLSLPRDDARNYLGGSETKTKDASAFNSLQKLKRSVSGAFGIGAQDRQRKCTRDVLDDNWLLSSSAPTSLQHSHVRVEASTRVSPSVWRPFAQDRDPDGDGADADADDDDDDDDDRVVDDNLAEDEEEDARANDVIERTEKTNDFPVIMKPPSFSYLTPGGHVMYLPETNEVEHRVQNMSGRKVTSAEYARTSMTIHEENNVERSAYRGEVPSYRLSGYDREDVNEIREIKGENYDEESKNDPSRRRKNVNDPRESSEFSNRVDSRENRPKQRRASSPFNENREPASTWSQEQPSSDAKGTKPQRKSNSKGKRFTFQSTVRQIERRRLAEKLSREAEAKERQRKGELEAMRKVEEEFQRKRAKEKANIRQQLRLFKEMEENFNSLPAADWDGSQLSRAEPDGAPSSTASSPTSLPSGNLSRSAPGKCFENEIPRKKDSDSDLAKQARAERKGYRPKYYDWPPETSSHLDYKQTTVHPKIVCDIPKSSPVFVDVNAHPGKPVASNSTPKSDNYRKDFAHGTVATRTSFPSSDSELSQPNTRPHSRQTGVKSKPHRARQNETETGRRKSERTLSRSGSPGRFEDAGTSEEDSQLVEARIQPRKPSHDFILTSGIQPFTKQKAYRPISFNPRPPPPIPS